MRLQFARRNATSGVITPEVGGGCGIEPPNVPSKEAVRYWPSIALGPAASESLHPFIRTGLGSRSADPTSRFGMPPPGSDGTEFAIFRLLAARNVAGSSATSALAALKWSVGGSLARPTATRA